MDRAKDVIEYFQTTVQTLPDSLTIEALIYGKISIPTVSRHHFKFILPKPATEADWKAFCWALSGLSTEDNLLSPQEAEQIAQSVRNLCVFKQE